VSLEERTGHVASVLAHVSLFAGWPRSALDEIAERFYPLAVPLGCALCREGEPGEVMYVIEEGHFAVEGLLGGKAVRLAERGPGAVVGEMALLTGQPQSATVTALTDARVWALNRSDYDQLLRSHPELGISTARTMVERIDAAADLMPANEKRTLLPLDERTDVVTIGRGADNHIVLPDPKLERIHALIQRIGDDYQIVDLNTASGTYVNGARVRSQVLKDGDEIWVGVNPIYFDRSALVQYSRGRGIQVDAHSLSRVVGHGLVTLNNISLSVYPGELVCIVGGSGAGKTTLLNALNGSRPATSGRVLYNGTDYYAYFDVFRHTLGYVPQDDIVHPELTVYETLYYAARLRLPPDTQRAEIDQRITDVLENLDLAGRRDHEVRQLSGGQRKRASIGVELLTQPTVFYLDEPTSGLDPGLDARMMQLFRRLADQGRTVVLTTHATKNIMLCDKVAFMARGGHLVFFGTPAAALEFFNVPDFTDIYTLLDRDDAPETWESEFGQSDAYRRNVQERLESSATSASPPRDLPAPGERGASGRLSSPRQLLWLSIRYLQVLRRDRILLALLLAQSPIIAAALASTFSHSVFAMQARAGGDARQAIVLLFNLVIASIWLGASNASRALTDEAPIYARERLVNLRVVPYVLSKVCILSLFSLVQAALLIGIVFAVIVLPGGRSVPLNLYLALALINLVGVALGLLVSSISRNSLQATAIVVILIIPQLIMAGADVPLSQMPLIGRALSNLMISRWGLSLVGHVVDMNTRLDAQTLPGISNAYAQQFAIDPLLYMLILVGFFALFLIGAMVALRRKRE